MDLHRQNLELSNEKQYRELSNISNFENAGNHYHKLCVKIDDWSRRRVEGQKLADLIGLTVKKVRIPVEIRGYLDTKEKTINISQFLNNEYLINLTIIHECSHFLLKHEILTKPLKDPYRSTIHSLNEDYREAFECNQREFEAKYLTSLIMLPTDLLLQDFEKHHSISHIERQFNVSPTQVMRRLNQTLFEEMTIPTHWVKSSNLRFIKHEIYDDYKLPSENQSVTEKYPALFRTPTYTRYYGLRRGRFAFEEKIDGKEFVTYVVASADPIESVCSAFGVPIKYANYFRFYHKMREFGPAMKPDKKPIVIQGATLRTRIRDWLKTFVLNRSSRKLISRTLMSVSGLLIVAVFTAYLNFDVPLRSKELWFTLIVALLLGTFSLKIKK